jgi:hypothetical protein
MPNIKPGYLGIAKVGNVYIRCTGFSINPTQEVLFYNHTIGLNDTVPEDSATKGEDITQTQTQRRIWRPSTINIAGSMTFPATVENINVMFDNAKNGSIIDSIDFKYYCGTGRSFRQCRVNSYEFSITAGDILNINVDVVARDIDQMSSSLPSYIEPQGLISHDEIKVTINGDTEINDAIIQGINFRINNNAMPIYTVTPQGVSNSLMPADIRLGMQEISGSIIIYLQQGREFIPIDQADPYEIVIESHSFNEKIYAVFQSNQMEGIVGPVVTTIPFVGVDRAFGD